jgi:DNA gyrase subunit A
VLGAGEELLLVSERGVIVRTKADAIPQQSRAATGVRLQKLDSGDRLSEVVLVPPAAEEEDIAEAPAAELSTVAPSAAEASSVEGNPADATMDGASDVSAE